MELRQLITFKAIVEHGSFIKAARALNYAQSSITSHIQMIEEFYGQPVFDRIGKKVALNDFGQIVYQRVCTLLAAYDDVCALKELTGAPAGRLRVGAPESTMLYRLAPVLQKFKTLFPQVELVMESGTCSSMRTSLRTGDLDLCVLLEQLTHEPDLEMVKLFEEPMGVVLPKEYPENELTAANRHIILYTEQGCSYRKIFQQLLEQKGVAASNVIETASVEVIKQYILCDIGVSFLPTVVVRREVETGQVKQVPWKNSLPVSVALARHKDKWVSPAMEAFMQLVREEAANWE